ncbi:MAG: hypothetical protein VX335_03135 [Pseudomonadota bacterium]|nr:hypothetical protein [Pseudomonadota bacterium]
MQSHGYDFKHRSSFLPDISWQSHHNAAFLLSTESIDTDFSRCEPSFINLNGQNIFNYKILFMEQVAASNHHTRIINTMQFQAILTLASATMNFLHEEKSFFAETTPRYNFYYLNANGYLVYVNYTRGRLLDMQSRDDISNDYVELFQKTVFNLNNSVTIDEFISNHHVLFSLLPLPGVRGSSYFTNVSEYEAYISDFKNDFKNKLNDHIKDIDGDIFTYTKGSRSINLHYVVKANEVRIYMPKVVEEEVKIVHDPSFEWQPQKSIAYHELYPGMPIEKKDFSAEWFTTENLKNNSSSNSCYLLSKLSTECESVKSPLLSIQFKIWEYVNTSLNTEGDMTKMLDCHHALEQYLNSKSYDSDELESLIVGCLKLADSDQTRLQLGLLSNFDNGLTQSVLDRLFKSFFVEYNKNTFTDLPKLNTYLNFLIQEYHSKIFPELENIVLRKSHILQADAISEFIKLKYKHKRDGYLDAKVKHYNKSLVSRFVFIFSFTLLLNKVMTITALLSMIISLTIPFYSFNSLFSLLAYPILNNSLNIIFCLMITWFLCGSIDAIFVLDKKNNTFRKKIFRDYNILKNNSFDNEMSLKSWLVDKNTLRAVLLVLRDISSFFLGWFFRMFSSNRVLTNSNDGLAYFTKIDNVINSEIVTDSNDIIASLELLKKDKSRYSNLLQRKDMRSYFLHKACTNNEIDSWIQHKRQV